MTNNLILAVAGSGKTQSIVDACTQPGAANNRVLAITYTRMGQRELSTRLGAACSPARAPNVIGWYAFLLGHFIRPYLPRLFAGQRLTGFNFEGEPRRYAKGKWRFLDAEGRAYRTEVARLAMEVNQAANGAPVDRLERRFTDIYLDEVQDLVGWDLDVLDALLQSSVIIHMVGDLRQSILETNPTGQKNKRYRGLEMGLWFAQREGNGLQISHQVETWRSAQTIANFADSIFEEGFDFPSTRSLQTMTTGHDGVFCVEVDQASAYVEEYEPQCLRHSKASTKNLDLPFRNFGEVKGLTFPRVLIYPTGTIKKFLTDKVPLESRSACGLYVAVTRARHSVAFLMKTAEAKKSGVPIWSPSSTV